MGRARRGTSRGTRARSRSSRWTRRSVSCSCANGAPRPADRCSSCRPERSTRPTAAAPRTRPARPPASSRRRPATARDAGRSWPSSGPRRGSRPSSCISTSPRTSSRPRRTDASAPMRTSTWSSRRFLGERRSIWRSRARSATRSPSSACSGWRGSETAIPGARDDRQLRPGAVSEQDRPLLAWYGDDVTGSTDVLEALGSAGVPAVLFLAPPSPERLATAFPGRTAVGVAGIARSLPTQEIPAEIEPVLRALRALDPALVHYKVCSTFDSSPDVGSIGAAVDTAWPIFTPDWVPVLVAAPALGRYTAFGTHFARYGDAVYRLDRHPVMARHPVTPMHEPDLRRHLALQTDRPIGLVDIRLLLGGPNAAAAALDSELEAGRLVVVLDGVDATSVTAAARLVWDRRPADHRAFAVGSSGLEPGLVAAWRDEGLLRDHDATRPPIGPATGPVLVVSGSGSEWTERQIASALDAGWSGIAWDTQRFLRDPDATIAAVTAVASAALQSGRNAVVHSALGPDDPRIERTRGAAAELGLTDRSLARRLGDGLGGIVRSLVGPGGPHRVVIAGGDASGWAARALGVEALDYVGSFDPGVPL